MSIIAFLVALVGLALAAAEGLRTRSLLAWALFCLILVVLLDATLAGGTRVVWRL